MNQETDNKLSEKINIQEKSRPTFKTIDIAYMAIMVVLLEVGKIALDWLPNVELISFMLIIFTLYFSWKVIPPVLIFALVECLRFGFGPWTVTYFYVWFILVVTVILTKKFGRSLGKKSMWFYAIVSGLFGLCFGALCAPYTLIFGGFKVMVSWWVSGLLYDLIHCVGNFCICLGLFYPVDKLMGRLRL